MSISNQEKEGKFPMLKNLIIIIVVVAVLLIPIPGEEEVKVPYQQAVYKKVPKKVYVTEYVTRYSGTLLDLGLFNVVKYQYTFSDAVSYDCEFTGRDLSGHDEYRCVIKFEDGSSKIYYQVNAIDVQPVKVPRTVVKTVYEEVLDHYETRYVVKNKEVTKPLIMWILNPPH